MASHAELGLADHNPTTLSLQSASVIKASDPVTSANGVIESQATPNGVAGGGVSGEPNQSPTLEPAIAVPPSPPAIGSSNPSPSVPLMSRRTAHRLQELLQLLEEDPHLNLDTLVEQATLGSTQRNNPQHHHGRERLPLTPEETFQPQTQGGAQVPLQTLNLRAMAPRINSASRRPATGRAFRTPSAASRPRAIRSRISSYSSARLRLPYARRGMRYRR